METLAYSFGPRDHAGQKPLRERPVERLDFVGVLMLGRAVAIIFGHPFMEHSVRAIVAWASRIATLEVGDVFACGTNHQGLGPMQDGEIGTIEIDGIGRMAVKVQDPQKRRWPFGIDRRRWQNGLPMETYGHKPRSRRNVPDRAHRVVCS